MIVYFTDRRLRVLGCATTELNRGYPITDDEKIQYLENGAVTFSVEIAYTDDNRLSLQKATAPGNFVLRSHSNENEFYTVISREIDTKEQTISLFCEDVGMELLNGVAGPYEAPEAKPASYYFNKWLTGTGFKIRTNQIKDLTRKLKWDGEASIMERLASIATQFGHAEVSYSFDVSGLEVVGKYVNIYKHRGKDRHKTLRLNYDIDKIEESETVENLATALLCTGGTPKNQNEPITLKGYTYDEGDFYVSGGKVISRSATKKWAVDGKSPIVRRYSYDTKSQETLCKRAITQLKKVYKSELEFRIDLTTYPTGVRIGDTVYIVDEKGELFLQSRVLERSDSITGDKYKLTLGDYVLKKSGISAQVEKLATQFSMLSIPLPLYTWIAYADDAAGNGISTEPEGKAYLGIAVNQNASTADLSNPDAFEWTAVEGGDSTPVMHITSSAGTLFKHTYIVTTLTAHVYLSGVELAAEAIAGLGTVAWYKNGEHVGTGLTLAINESSEVVKGDYVVRLED